MFKINSHVLYNCNVCKVKDIVKNSDKDYYVLVPINDESLTIKAPLTQENIRKLLSKKEINRLINNMPNIKTINYPNHQLEAEYKKLLNTGNREDLVRIIKTTYLRNKERLDSGKKKGEKDNTYMLLAEKSLYSEIGTVLNMSLDDAKEYVINKINKK
ncbi:MAG: CarD family transcriptional regulator [Bacilli bacterium]|nr:CarD family transcriptional regulator [Bacilli bacterium]